MAANAQHPKLLYAAAAAVVLLVVIGAVVHWRMLASRQADLAAVEADARRAAEANGAESKAARDLPNLRSAAKSFARSVPTDPNLTSLLGSAGADAGQPGLPEREIVSRPTVIGQPVARVPFLLQYRGSFAGTLTLLQRLQDGPLLTRVERVVIENESSTDGDKPLRVQLEFSTFARTSKELEAWAQAE